MGVNSFFITLLSSYQINFWLTSLKIFLKAFWTLKYNNFEGGSARQKTRFFCSKISKKILKTIFLACYFEKFCQNRVFTVIIENSDIQFGQLEDKFRPL